ncbi:hypothetical protein [Helicobacter sp. MIT 14-3879]|uniref:hypothetical protein n=1 Tax=Helicobacter sp. MIT 14-3879 TaxID=2040649 RepID=UPI000E1EAE7E|nr:hypothetical protein [Helicobacter sp. MIT 14-3879]RDU63154.1 hypothetical protein CQA44_05815 [Helicobacter sp. MIT 14-3879]
MRLSLKSSILLGSVILLSNINATEIKIDSYGYVGAIYNQGFIGANKNHSVIGLTARAGANFYFDYGLSVGLAATGAWAALDNKKNNLFLGFNSSKYPNTGDVSDAFIRYIGDSWSISGGRFDASFLEFDWLANSIQGVGFNYKDLYKNRIVKKMDLWLTYFNSILTTGYQPNRIGSELGTMYAYHPGGRNNFVGQNGGNVVAGGLNMNLAGFVLDPYILFNNSVAHSNDILVQVGTKFGYIIDFARDWRSSTLLRAMFQYAPNYLTLNDDFGFLAWVDQEFKYSNWLKFGLGFYFVGGESIWYINDNSRFYGSWTNALNNNYFAKDNWSAYLFGSFDLINNRLGIDIMLAGGDYTEFSAILKYTAWKGNTMKTDIGGGYVYFNNKNNYGKGDNLIVFAKLSY